MSNEKKAGHPMKYYDAQELARFKHEGQLDLSGRPYFEHLNRVFNYVISAWPDSTSDDELCAAWLHDIIEDTDITAVDLLIKGFSPKTVEIVVLLTHKKDDERPYLEYVQDIIDSGNISAIKVKLADNYDNGDPFRAKPLTQKIINFWKTRYFPARIMLHEALLNYKVEGV
jgi:(p)ppGpp synthase/HD superfamily hydrolase